MWRNDITLEGIVRACRDKIHLVAGKQWFPTVTVPPGGHSAMSGSILGYNREGAAAGLWWEGWGAAQDSPRTRESWGSNCSGTDLEKPRRSSSDPVSEKSNVSKYLNLHTLFSVFDSAVTAVVMLEDFGC